MTDGSAILLPALGAGGVAILVTVAIERFGGRVGGFLGTLPTTIVPAAWGLYANEPEVFRAALGIAPAGMLANALFLLGWRVLPDRLPDLPLPALLGVMVTSTLSLWALAAWTALALADRLRSAGLAPEVIGMGATVLLIGLGVWACLASVPTPRGTRRVGPGALLARGTLAGVAIGGSLLLARSGLGALAGIASVFPAIFLTSMVGVWWSQGRAVTGGAVGPMMLGSASVAVYALLAVGFLPLLGPLPGTVVAWVFAVATTTVPASLWLGRRAERAARE
jgi:hypothetical protein